MWQLVPSGLRPAYRFPQELPTGGDCVVVDRSNSSLLEGTFDDYIPELELVQPCVVALVDGRPVAICHSSRLSPSAAEAGIETLPPLSPTRIWRARGGSLGVACTRVRSHTPLQHVLREHDLAGTCKKPRTGPVRNGPASVGAAARLIGGAHRDLGLKRSNCELDECCRFVRTRLVTVLPACR